MGNWKSRVMVQHYAHLADEELRKAAATIVFLVNVGIAEEADERSAEEAAKNRLSEKASLRRICVELVRKLS